MSSWVYLPQGGRYDPLTGLVDRRGRVYSTSLGRWIQQDPAGYADSSNLYQYTKSNPLAFTDPSGLESLADQAWDLSDEVRGDDLAALTQIETAAHEGVAAVQRAATFGELLSDGLFGSDSPFGGFASAFGGMVSSVANWLNADTDSVFRSFVQGAWAGVLNVADDFMFQQSESLHNYRNGYWDTTGLAGTWYETGSNAAAWTAVVAYNAATIIDSLGLDVELGGSSSDGFLCPTSCFVAGTPVLLGDGKTERAIDQIHVGQRVATDGGIANSADGKTSASDPDHTDVDPKTWRLVNLEIDARTADGGIDVMQVQELMPLALLRIEHAKTGAHIPVPLDLGDINEAGEGAAVRSVDPCPVIQPGPGRVVLTTITHLNDYGFHLTLSDAASKTETLGITGLHKLYTEDRGWIPAADLKLGEQIRGAHGSLTVVKLVRNPGMHRVYNLEVESDHIYYVGLFTALSHNVGGGGCGSFDPAEIYKQFPQAERDAINGALGVGEQGAIGASTTPPPGVSADTVRAYMNAIAQNMRDNPGKPAVARLTTMRLGILGQWLRQL